MGYADQVADACDRAVDNEELARRQRWSDYATTDSRLARNFDRPLACPLCGGDDLPATWRHGVHTVSDWPSFPATEPSDGVDAFGDSLWCPGVLCRGGCSSPDDWQVDHRAPGRIVVYCGGDQQARSIAVEKLTARGVEAAAYRAAVRLDHLLRGEVAYHEDLDQDSLQNTRTLLRAMSPVLPGARSYDGVAMVWFRPDPNPVA